MADQREQIMNEPDSATEAIEDADVAEILEQAQGNAQALIIATVAFLDGRGVPLDAWTEAIGATFAQSWDETDDWEAGDFMEAMLTNFRSLGAKLTSSSLGPDRAEAVTVGFPDPEFCTLFGVDPARVAQFNDTTTVIAAKHGIIWSWRLEGEETRYVAERGA